jgi:hypothetical protein
MALRIACDLDGTVADMNAALQREAETLFGPNVDLRAGMGGPREPPSDADVSAAAEETAGDPVKKEDVSVRRGLSSREYRQLWAHVRNDVENFWATLNEFEPGSIARFHGSARKYGWEVIFLTQRPASAGEPAQIQSQRWLEAHGFELPSVYVVNGSRGKIAASLGLDAVIDDRPENCLDVTTESEAKSFLVWRDPPETAPPGAARMKITTVFAFAEALDKLEALSSAKTASSIGLMGRIRQTLGI